MRHVWNFFKKPWLFLGLFAVSIILEIVGACLAPYQLVSGMRVCPAHLQSFAVSPEGKLAVSEYDPAGSSYLCAADADSTSLRWILLPPDLAGHCGIASRCELLFGEGGELFMHCVCWTEDNNAI